MRLFPILCLLFFSLGMASCYLHCSRFQKKKKKDKESSMGAVITPGGRDFAFDLYRALVSEAPGQNILFSPMTVSMSLGMLALGAGSHTKKQILDALNIQQGQEDKLHKGFQQLLEEFSKHKYGLKLILGSALFADLAVHFQDSFMNATKIFYMADKFFTNFGDPEGAKKQINDYVAKKTGGKIVDLIKNLDSTHIMMMVNYISFKGKWETTFSPENTHQKDFYVTPKKTIQVHMMNREDEYYYFLDQNLSCTVVGIPYQGNTLGMFILPMENNMQQVENGLNEETLRNWLKKFTKRRLDLYLPKFSLEGIYQLEKILPKLGIKDVFSSHADLSGISSHTNIKLSEMMHKAMMEVDESGTTAAAATGMLFTFRSARPTSMMISFNRPFLLNLLFEERVMYTSKVTSP